MSAEVRSSPPGFVVLYRWRLHPGTENGFTQAWSHVTNLLRSRGSLGARLHRGSDGLWYSYAQWPDAQSREKAFAAGPVDASASAQIREAVAESFPEIVLDVAADFIAPTE
ncbi:MAG: antibiotic biosynthesis monooxygenase [Alphaproteobacteria bacterium]|nr:antibiotic biosynthesis monooxygenase [Alphaproteobacteria bacterium]